MALSCQGKAAIGFWGAGKVMGKNLINMGSGFNFKLGSSCYEWGSQTSMPISRVENSAETPLAYYKYS
jgi:hypothetical protein